MNERTATVVVEVALVAMIAIGIVFAFGWPYALIVFGVLMLIGTQGLTPRRDKDGD